MSYTRTFHGSVSGSQSKTVSYPASQNGGSHSVTVHWEEPISITVHVETSAFQNSVSHCHSSLTALAGSVVASEAAQVAAVTANAHRVASKVIQGFYQLIRSEIAQQIELCRSQCTALAPALRQTKAECEGKWLQMRTDYERISGRYAKVFQSLDRELWSRVHAVDRPAFALIAAHEEQRSRAAGNSSSSTPTVFHTEELAARTTLGIGRIRRTAMQIMQRGREFLEADRRMAANIDFILSPGEGSQARQWSVPVLYYVADATDSLGAGETLSTGSVAALNDQQVRSGIANWFRAPQREWAPLEVAARGRIEQYLKLQVSALAEQNGESSQRVAAMIVQLWERDRPATVRR